MDDATTAHYVVVLDAHGVGTVDIGRGDLLRGHVCLLLQILVLLDK